MNPANRHFEIGRSLFREANDAFFLFDPATRMIVDLNPAAQRLTGLEKDEACSKRLEDLFSAPGAGGLDAMTDALDRTGFFHSREGYELRRGALGDLPVNVSVSRIHTEPEPVGLVVARDISGRKKAEEALKQVEARYNSLVASTGVMVWELGADGTLVSISPAFETITGWSSSDWVGRPLDDLLDPDDREKVLRMHDRAWQGETLPRYEVRIRGKTGNSLDCEFLLVTKVRQGPTERILAIIARYHRAETVRTGPPTGRRAAPGQGRSRTSQSGQERVPLQRQS